MRLSVHHVLPCQRPCFAMVTDEHVPPPAYSPKPIRLGMSSALGQAGGGHPGGGTPLGGTLTPHHVVVPP